MRAAALDRQDLAPPPQPGLVRGVVLALLAHAVLLLALTFGVRWNRDDTPLSAEAELWSPTPQQAAPRPVEPPPAPPPPPPQPQPTPPAPPPAPPAPREADIALERDRQRRLQEKQRADELERQRQLAEQQKKLAAQKKQEEQARLAKQKEEQARAAKQKQDEQARAARQKDEQAAKLREEMRREQINRAQGLAGATGSPSATGTALRASGPSDSYAGRIRSRVQPNIVFGDFVSGNPEAEVEVRMAPDGTITSTRVVKGSGVKAWDDAVVRALERTGTLPRDVDGRVHSPVIITFRPKG